MSRIAKYPIEIPSGVTVEVKDRVVSVKGAKGELKKEFNDFVDVSIADGKIVVDLKSDDLEDYAFWGTVASHIKNMIEGVSKGFEKKLEIQGIGYKGEVKGNELTFNLGFSHPIVVSTPLGLTTTIEKGIVTVSGIDKEEVGAFAAKIRSFKKPEPYKGKGIRYQGEYIEIKQGKKSA
jgi:large subunit ribosomal protein L6